MTVLRRLTLALAFGLALLGAAGTAGAAPLYRYTVEAGASDGFAATGFSLDSTRILAFGESTMLNPVGTPDGLAVTRLTFDAISNCNSICRRGFSTNFRFGLPAGSVAAFNFYVLQVPVDAVGSYTIGIARLISANSNGIINAIVNGGYVAGTLTITDITPVVTPVPEPTSLALLGTGLLGLAAARPGRRGRTGRPGRHESPGQLSL